MTRSQPGWRRLPLCLKQQGANPFRVRAYGCERESASDYGIVAA